MANNIESMQKLINAFTLLPGVGQKTAERYAYSIIKLNADDVNFMANSLVEAKKNIHYCSVCGNFTDNDICDICKNRKSDIVCVVKEPKDVLALEKARNFKVRYHVLHGTISPLENRGPNDIRIKELVERINSENIKEVILATNPRVEGEATAMYLSKLIKPLGVKVTRIAHGIPVGGDLEYTDEITLTKALEGRREI